MGILPGGLNAPIDLKHFPVKKLVVGIDQTVDVSDQSLPPHNPTIQKLITASYYTPATTTEAITLPYPLPPPPSLFPAIPCAVPTPPGYADDKTR